MKKANGRYALIQYSAAPERFEFVNIGVVLIDPNSRFFGLRFAQSSKRIDQMFGKQPRLFLPAVKSGLQNRLRAELGSEWDIGRLEKFAASRANSIRLSKLQPILIEDAEQDLNDLFRSLVFDEGPSHRQPKVATELKRRFERAGVERFVEKPQPVNLPQGVKIEAPYAYQNGAYNLIDPVRLTGEPGEAFAQASKRAVQGQWLFQYSKASAKPQQLVVVGDIGSQESSFVAGVRKMMSEHSVKFYDMQHVDPLLEDIKKNAPKAGVSLNL
jgi:hypothetical protein